MLVKLLLLVVALPLAFQLTLRGFVPGLFPAAPVAAVGVWGVQRRVAGSGALQVVAIGGLVSLPVVWAFEWVGNLTAQWGGRYLLVGAVLLTTVGAAAIAGGDRDTPRIVLVVVAIAVGVSGLVWHVERTSNYATVIDDLVAAPCDQVLIVTSPFLLREGGSFDAVRRGGTEHCRYLSASPSDIDTALSVAACFWRDPGDDPDPGC